MMTITTENLVPSWRIRDAEKRRFIFIDFFFCRFYIPHCYTIDIIDVHDKLK